MQNYQSCPLFQELPERVALAYLGLSWDLHKLWRLEIPAETVSPDGLYWHLDCSFWATEPPRKVYDLTPRKVLRNPAGFARRMDRVHSADLDYPIHLVNLEGRWVILDGIHRLAKCQLLGVPGIQVRRLQHAHLPLIGPESPVEEAPEARGLRRLAPIRGLFSKIGRD